MSDFNMSVDIILQEIQIRIDKLTEFKEDQKNKDPERAAITEIRLNEYKSFKQWIEIRK